MSWRTLAVDGLAVYRVTRLVTADTITEPVRWRIIEAAYEAAGRAATWRDATINHGGTWDDVAHEDPNPPKLAVLVTCRWCTGYWVALLAVAARRFAPRAWEPIARASALSAVAALLAGLEED